MKSLQELYNEVMADEDLRRQYFDAKKTGKQIEFAREHGCDPTKEEYEALRTEQDSEDEALSFDELESVAGGTGGFWDCPW